MRRAENLLPFTALLLVALIVGVLPPADDNQFVPYAEVAVAEPPEVPPGFVPERPENPNVVWVGNCIVPVDAVEIFPDEAVASRQRIFDSGVERTYIRPDGSCVSIIKHPDIPVPDSVPAATVDVAAE